MFRVLRLLANTLRRYVAELTAQTPPAPQAARLVDCFAEIERLAALCRTLAAGRVADSELWRQDGDRSPAHWLARRVGTTVGGAARDLATVSTVAAGLAATAAALGEGTVSLGQARHVARAATLDPTSEAELLDLAVTGSMGELVKQADRREAAARSDAEGRHEAVRRGRFFRHFRDHLGGFGAELRTTPEEGARLLAGLRPWFRVLARTAHARGEDEPVEALMVDALVQACTATTPAGAGQPATKPTEAGGGSTENGPTEDAPTENAHENAATDDEPTEDETVTEPTTGPPSEGGPGTEPETEPAGSGPATQPPAVLAPEPAAESPAEPVPEPAAEPPAEPVPESPVPAVPVRAVSVGGGRYRDCKVIVRVDHPAVKRGHTHPGETCEVAGVGPLPVSVVRDMISGGAFVAAVVTSATNVTGVAHLGRRPTGIQATALQWRDAQCCVQGCSADGYLETDHRSGWAVTGQTSVDDLDRLCSHHHSLKTNQGYRLAAGTGKRPMRPPPSDEPP